MGSESAGSRMYITQQGNFHLSSSSSVRRRRGASICCFVIFATFPFQGLSFSFIFYDVHEEGEGASP